MVQREHWGSRIGLILAAAGNAIGIGNLLRFPGQAAEHGGGAFMIPYVVSLLLFGLPAMWVAWTVGRYGGKFGHGTTPGMFDRMVRSPLAKYFGVLGVALPIIFCLYYTYIESWCLGYAFFSLTGDYLSTPERHVYLPAYLNEFLGAAPTHDYFSGVSTALVFLLITLGLNIFILYRGVARGIELLAKTAVPLLFLFCVVLSVRVFTLEDGKGSALSGLEYLWTPKLEALKNPEVWVAAAGQIFFTLSIGFGSLECYASYLREEDDIALTGLTTAATNEFVEIIFGSLIAIPAAAVFFGSEAIRDIAGGGTFHIGMISMPEVLRATPGVQVFGTIWFLLLFLAAFTSSVAVCQPVMAFFEDEARLRRGTAAMVVGLLWLLGTLPVIYFTRYGFLDELDFWAGQIGLVVFSAVEVVIFAWIFGADRGFEELHRGADIRVPFFFRHIIRFVTPVLLLALLGWWFVDAIREDKLIPTPQLKVAELDRDRYAGDFEMKKKQPEAAKKAGIPPAPRELTPEEEARKEEFEKRIKDRVAELRRDLKAWVDVEVSADETVRVTKLQGDPELLSAIDEAAVQDWLKALGYRYVIRRDRGAGEPVPQAAAVTLVIEGLHRAPFIWLARLLIFAFTCAFIGAIAVIWRTRRRGGEEGAP